MCKTWVHPQVYGVVRVAHLFSFLCCVVFLCYVCLRPVYFFLYWSVINRT
jgi:hypothetical protein